MKKMLKTIGVAAAALLCIIVVLLVLWAIISRGKIREYDGPKSLSEKFVKEINGAPNGFFINSSNIDNPVLLLVSSGPGTDDYVFTDIYEEMHLEDAYTVVYWDYRWMGIAYESDARAESITLSNLTSDTHSVTSYLKERFGKEKIYIMGFSGGSHIALNAVYEHPEDYFAYIGMAQCVTDLPENDTLIYDFCRKVFEKRGDRGALSELEASVEHLYGGRVKCRDWYEFVMLLHKAGGGTIRDKSEFTGIVWPIITCGCYTIGEKIDYVKAMKMYRTTPLSRELDGFDYRESKKTFDIPVYFISGEYDYNCPWELVKEYHEIIKAPDKDFFLIPEAAHSPLWENPDATYDIMVSVKERTGNG